MKGKILQVVHEEVVYEWNYGKWWVTPMVGEAPQDVVQHLQAAVKEGRVQYREVEIQPTPSFGGPSKAGRREAMRFARD